MTAKIFLFFVEIITVVSALVVAVHPNIVYSALALFITLCGVATMYFFAGADFIAVIQIIIYAGGVVIITLFAIMLTKSIYKVRLSDLKVRIFIPSILAIISFFLIYRLLTKIGDFRTFLSEGSTNILIQLPKANIIGEGLINEHLIAFEAITILLLGALVGAVFLMRSKK